MIILSNGSIIKLSNGNWLNVQETQNISEPTPRVFMQDKVRITEYYFRINELTPKNRSFLIK